MPKQNAAAKFIKKLLEVWRLSKDDAAKLLGVETEAQSQLFLNGYYNPSGRDFRDRVRNLITIRSSLASLFRDTSVEADWLRVRHRQLAGKSPLDLLRDGSMESLITVRQLIEWLSGR